MPTDYAGNSLTTARAITVNANTQILKDWVGATDTDDFYRFTLTNRSSFSLGIDGLTADADVRLFDSSSNIIQQSSNSGTIPEEINSLLEAGTYYLRVYSNDLASTNYSLRVLGKVDLAGNSFDTARAITVNSTTKLYSESVSGTIDPEDYYRFTLNSTSNFNLTIDGLSGYSNVELFNSYGNGVVTSWSGGNGLPQSLNSLLTAGTYYIRVNGDGLYDLRVAATPDLAGNYFDTARAIALSSTTRLYSESIGGQSDSDDYYRFTLSNRSIFNLNLDGWRGNGNVELLNSNGNWIDGINVYAGFTTINNVLAAGTYYIRVNSFDSTIANYNLRVSATPDLAGNDLNTARAIAISPTSRIYTESINSQFDSADYYRFTLNTSSDFKLFAKDFMVNFGDVQLLDSNGNLLSWALLDSGYPIDSGYSRSMNSFLEAGTYYIKVMSYDPRNFKYEIRVSATPDLADNYPDWGRTIAVSPTTTIYSGVISGQKDPEDYYRFTLNTASTLKLDVDGLNANTNLEVFNNSDTWLYGSSSGNGLSKNITSLLAAGNYYIRVSSFSETSSNYELRVAAIPNSTVTYSPGADLAGNTIQTARAIALTPTTKIYSESIGGQIDNEDYYRFILNTVSDFKLNLDQLSANAYVQLLDSNGNTIYVPWNNSSDGSLTINSLLAAGTYYIKVDSFDSTSNRYEMRVSAVSDLAGNYFNTARAISVTPTTTIYTDSISQLDSEDYYRFTLNNTSIFNLTLDGLNWSSDVQLLDSNGNWVPGAYSVTNGLSVNIDSILAAGTYYIRINPSLIETNRAYELSVSAVSDLAGNYFNTARAIALSPTTTIYTESVGQIDSQDYYRFTLNTSSVFNLDIEGVTFIGDIELFDNNANFVYGSSVNTFDQTVNISKLLAAGTYYIKLNALPEWKVDYEMRVSATPDLAGNDFNTAKAIAISPTTTTYSESVGGFGDTEDNYRFTLNATSVVNLNIDGLSNNTSLQLFDINGNAVDAPTYPSGSSSSISSLLAAGTYYVKISNYSGASSNYNLRVSAAPEIAGDTLNTARTINVGTTTTTYSESISSQADTSDYYRFSLSTNRFLNLALDGLTANADVELLDSSGNTIKNSINWGSSDKYISEFLAAGTYYLRVYPSYSSSGAVATNYNLRLLAS